MQPLAVTSIHAREQVVVTSLVKGTAFWAVWRDDQLHMSQELLWSKGALFEDLTTLKRFPGLKLHGVFWTGMSEDDNGQYLACFTRYFDVYSEPADRWLDMDGLDSVLYELELPKVPVLYYGPWSPDVLKPEWGEVVVRPRVERVDANGERAIFMARAGRG